MRQSWRSALGLASRALLITVQRFLDCWSIARGLGAPHASCAPALLLAGLVVTTALMAATMQRHWSAMKRGRAHGCPVGLLMASLQIAPLWEMLDKTVCRNRARDADGGPLAARQPLLKHESSQTRSPGQPRSDLPKGSPGENAMRGVRKMSMVNLPQAMLSLWVHARQLAPVGGDGLGGDRGDGGIWPLAFAFAAAFLCVAFGIADFVLYIWVHDAFVRDNKKLVTLHYCVEILCRVPAVVVFHVSYSQQYHYVPTLVLFLVDVLLTSLLLLVSRLSKPESWWDMCSCFPRRTFTYRSIMQFMYSLVVSVQLFVVNVVFFDPGMIFFYVNQAFYVIKYVELAVMLHLIRVCHASGILEASPSTALNAFWWTEIAFAAVNAFLVWVYVPLRRAEKDARLTNNMTPGSNPDEHPDDWAALALGRPTSAVGEESDRMLERLEEIFELLRLLSLSACPRNRARLLHSIVGELWLQALRWDGEYADGSGGTAHIVVGRPQCVLARVRCSPGVWCTALLDGPSIIMPGGAGALAARHGYFDGVALRWEDGQVWTHRGNVGCGAASGAVLRLILPQLALALRWDTPGWAAHAGGDAPGLHGGPQLDPEEAGDVILGHAPQEAGGADADAAAEHEVGGRPLLNFLVRYAAMTRQADFVSDLYWALVCLSYDDGPHHHHPHHRAVHRGGTAGPSEAARAYRAARLALLRLLRGDLLLDEGPEGGPPQPHGNGGGPPPAGPGPGPPPPHGRGGGPELAAFLEHARRLLRGQRELWHQKGELLAVLAGSHGAPSCGGWSGVGRASGSGAWAHRTEDFREALRHWPEIRRRRGALKMDEDGVLLHAQGEEPACGVAGSIGRSTSDLNAAADLVSPDGPYATLPIDPTVGFRGVIVEECEVVPSKHAPLLFSCWTTGSGGGEACMVREKYLLKTGDDLRQDQLMLQLMALMGCVWQERLAPHDARALQLAKFRVLAVTPHSGYVKFVPDAVPLTDALHQSHGDLAAWLESNRPGDMAMEKVLDNLCGSVAASCVVTYILGIGDRHLENLCITRRGQFFHIDFSFVLGDDPKPCAPQVRLPQQVAQVLLATDRLERFFGLAARAYLALRPCAGLWGSILQLTAAAGGAGCAKLEREPLAAVAGVRERLRVDQVDDDRAASEFLCLVRESSEGLASILMDKVHAAGLFWR